MSKRFYNPNRDKQSNDRSFEQMLKKFRKASAERGRSDDHYIKPSEERCLAESKAEKREEKRVEKSTPKPRQPW